MLTRPRLSDSLFYLIHNKPSVVRAHPKPLITIVLDIDKTLASRVPDLDALDSSYSFLDGFKKKQLLLELAIGNYILHPGSIEFIQYLFRSSHFNVHFFSLGSKLRNDQLVKALLTRALGEEEYALIKDKVRIFSREQAEVNFATGKLAKNLKMVPTSLATTILIDDNLDNMWPTQEANFLKVLGCSFEKFQLLNLCRHSGKLVQATNHIFYIVGLLDALLHLNKSEVTKNLFKMQYPNQGPSNKHRERCPVLFAENKYYLRGLAVLKHYGPQLEFYGRYASPYFNKAPLSTIHTSSFFNKSQLEAKENPVSFETLKRKRH